MQKDHDSAIEQIEEGNRHYPMANARICSVAMDPTFVAF